MTPLISALVLNTKEPLNAVKCVHALRVQTIADQLEIIVIDNHSDDDSIGILRNRLKKFSNVRVIESPTNAGFGGGYALGIRQARGQYLLLNNPAKLLEADAVEKMLRKMESDPHIGIVAPKLVHEDGTIRLSARSFPKMWDVIAKRAMPGSEKSAAVKRYLQSDVSPDEERPTDWVIGGCMLMRSDLMKELEGFDPRFFLFFEDMDLCRRVKEKGYSIVYFPQAVAVDRKKRLSEMPLWKLPFKRTGRAHIGSAIKYFAKWRGKPV